MLVAVDCVIFGFDGAEFKLLLIQKNIEPNKKTWSLIDHYVLPDENLENTPKRILKQLTGLENVFLTQIYTFGNLELSATQRTIHVAYLALICIDEQQEQLNGINYATWFPLNQHPVLNINQQKIVASAKEKLREKAIDQSILLELLPHKFTLPQLLNLHEQIFGLEVDKRNFRKKVLATNMLIQQKDKDKTHSKKGAFYYILNEKYVAA